MSGISGLDKLTKKMEQLTKVMAELDGNLANVRIDPFDPQSIELAIQNLDNAIDEKTHKYSNNELVQNMAIELKENNRSAILGRAEQARLEAKEK